MRFTHTFPALPPPARSINVTYVEPSGEPVTVSSKLSDNETLMTLAIRNKLDMEGACEGQIACSTCHVVLPADVYQRLAKAKPMSEEEQDMLDTAFGLTATSRLGCQIPVSLLGDGVKVVIPAFTR